MATIQYCHEKFAKALEVLATHPEELRVRLRDACLEAGFAPLEPLTGEAAETYAAMRQRWLNPGGGNGIGRYLDTLSEPEMVAEAKLLVSLEYLTRP
jgi:hypothetical protein